MWSFTDKGLKEAVVKQINSFKTKDAKDQAHFDSVKSAIVADVNAIKTNGVTVQATGNIGEDNRRLTVNIGSLKLTV